MKCTSSIGGLLLVFCLFAMNGCKKTDTTINTDPTSVTDVDGNVYPVKRICGKLWMTENLRTTRYNDSSVIPTGLSDAAWASTSAGAYSVYNSIASNNTTYGKLYNWFAANHLKLAPIGWHVATEAEWAELVNCVGGSSVAGGKLKSISSLWSAPNTNATDSSGFNAMPAGWRAMGGGFALLGEAAYFWGSNERNSTQGEYMVLRTDFGSVTFNGATKQFGYSIRCVKD